MLEEYFDDVKRCVLRIDFSRELNPWELLQYCRKTINNFVKLTTLENFKILLTKDFKISDFYILPKSRDLYENVSKQSYRFRYGNDEDIISADSYSKIKLFWETFFKLERPVVCIKQNKELIPIYQHKNNTSVKLQSVIVNCPPVINMEVNSGIGELLDTIIFYNEKKEGYQLDNEKKKWEIMLQNLDILSKIVDIAEKLKTNSPTDSNLYLKNMLDYLVYKQNELDILSGVSSRKIDRIVYI
jgi:hypothetical protein